MLIAGSGPDSDLRPPRYRFAFLSSHLCVSQNLLEFQPIEKENQLNRAFFIKEMVYQMSFNQFCSIELINDLKC